MSYAAEGDAGFRISSFSGLISAIGRLAAMAEKIINREVIQADANNAPVARPVDEVDSRMTLESLDQAMAVAESTAAANQTIGIQQADGGSGSLVMGKMVASSVQHTFRRRMGGFGCQQTLEMQDSTLTYTPTA